MTSPAELEDRTTEARSRPHRAGLRPPFPLSPEEEIRDRSGVGLRSGEPVSDSTLREESTYSGNRVR